MAPALSATMKSKQKRRDNPLPARLILPASGMHNSAKLRVPASRRLRRWSSCNAAVCGNWMVNVTELKLEPAGSVDGDRDPVAPGGRPLRDNVTGAGNTVPTEGPMFSV
jgi:hypothetical protein